MEGKGKERVANRKGWGLKGQKKDGTGQELRGGEEREGREFVLCPTKKTESRHLYSETLWCLISWHATQIKCAKFLVVTNKVRVHLLLLLIKVQRAS